MPNPWDRPPIATIIGDRDESMTFAAVGHALSAWERMETNLARLYAAFLGIKPLEAVQRDEYLNAQIFWQRKKVIVAAAQKYTTEHPSQEIEGAFNDLIARIEGYAGRRHDIAHGVVQWGIETTLGPAQYREKDFDQSRDPQYLYSSIEIESFADAFRRLKEEIETLLLKVLLQNASLSKLAPPTGE